MAGVKWGCGLGWGEMYAGVRWVVVSWSEGGESGLGCGCVVMLKWCEVGDLYGGLSVKNMLFLNSRVWVTIYFLQRENLLSRVKVMAVTSYSYLV